MKFRTEINVAQSGVKINHQSKILMIGSCFANSIGEKLSENKFDVCLNPFGTLYNPVSIKRGLELLLGKRTFTEADIFFDKGLYHSFYFHSSFSLSDKADFIRQVNRHIEHASNMLRQANILFITFGTSYVFEYSKTGEVVGNCHKLPASDFRRYRLNVEQIIEEWKDLIGLLAEINPQLQLIFTVSPIRHLKDGVHDNQLSKAILLLSVEQLNRIFGYTSYFPSYEIVLDDLRDYRFYEVDMCHPNKLAIEYIWEKLGETYFEENTDSIIREWVKIKQALNHKPFDPGGEDYIQFLKQTLLKLNAFQVKYPFISLTSEIENLRYKADL